MTIEDFNINYVDTDSSKKYRVLVYSSVQDLTSENFLVIPKEDYDKKFAQYSDMDPRESAKHSELRTCEHFMYLHEVIDELFIHTLKDFYKVDMESESNLAKPLAFNH